MHFFFDLRMFSPPPYGEQTIKLHMNHTNLPLDLLDRNTLNGYRLHMNRLAIDFKTRIPTTMQFSNSDSISFHRNNKIMNTTYNYQYKTDMRYIYIYYNT